MFGDISKSAKKYKILNFNDLCLWFILKNDSISLATPINLLKFELNLFEIVWFGSDQNEIFNFFGPKIYLACLFNLC